MRSKRRTSDLSRRHLLRLCSDAFVDRSRIAFYKHDATPRRVNVRNGHLVRAEQRRHSPVTPRPAAHSAHHFAILFITPSTNVACDVVVSRPLLHLQAGLACIAAQNNIGHVRTLT